MEVSPATSPQAANPGSAFSSLTQNIDTFLTLLTTQLRNQDPLKPLDTEKFTEQLVQFASVEQSIQTNAHLEALINLQSAADRDTALHFVGQQTAFATDRAELTNGRADWTYTLPSDAQSTLLRITDQAGRVLATRAGAVSPGEHVFTWNGVTDDGRAAPPGIYRLAATTLAADGAPLPVETQSDAEVTAIRFADDGPKLETILGLMSLDTVRRVTGKEGN